MRNGVKKALIFLLTFVVFAGGFSFGDRYTVWAEETETEEPVPVKVLFQAINIDTGERVAYSDGIWPSGEVFNEPCSFGNGFVWFPDEQYQRTWEFVSCDTSFPLTVGKTDITINQYYKLTYYDVSETGNGQTYNSLEELYAAREANSHIHSYTETITADATCTTDGTKTFTCDCGDTYTETINATGHSFSSYIYNNNATYEADGTETAVCYVCGATDTRTVSGTQLIPETQHSHSYAVTTINATCTDNGTRTNTCSCGDSYTETISAVGHNYGAYTYNNDATYYADGTESAACANCGAVDTRPAGGTKLIMETQAETTAPAVEIETTKEAATAAETTSADKIAEPDETESAVLEIESVTEQESVEETEAVTEADNETETEAAEATTEIVSSAETVSTESVTEKVTTISPDTTFLTEREPHEENSSAVWIIIGSIVGLGVIGIVLYCRFSGKK